MNDRIQRALDGELPTDQLSPDELAEYHRYGAAFCTALGPIEDLASIDVAPDVIRRVTRRGTVRRRLGALVEWLWSPRPVSLAVRPAFALAGAVMVAALAWLTAPGRAPAPATIATAHPAPGAPTRVLVQFRLGDTQAREVALVGDFNAWRPVQQLHQIAAGVWSVEIALEPGVYNYGFIIDGKTWRLDPLAPQITDGFGGASSRVAVLPPETRS